MPSITTQAGALDVQGLVQQLMAVEEQELTAVKRRIDKYTTQLSDVGRLKSDLSALQSTLRDLRSGNLLTTFKTESSSKEILNGSANSFALPGVYQFEVLQLAQGQNMAFDNQPSFKTSLNNNADILTITFQDGSEPTAIEIDANATLDDIRQAINKKNIGISALIVNSGESAKPSKLVFSSSRTGKDQEFSLSLANNDPSLAFLTKPKEDTVVSEAKDAVVKVNGVQMNNASNVLKDVIPGVTVNLSKVGSSNLTVSRDDEAIEKKIQSFVDAYNKIRSTIDSVRQRGLKEDGSLDPLRQGSLKGDASILTIKDQLAAPLSRAVAGVDATQGLAYLSQLGLTQNGITNSDGQGKLDGSLKFDSKIFRQAMDKGLQGVANLFGNDQKTGIADQLAAKVTEFLAPTGVIETKYTSINRSSREMVAQQDRIEAKLKIKQQSYTAQFAALDASLVKIRDTGNYLARVLR